MVDCVLHGPVEAIEVGIDARCGQVHLVPTKHTLGGEPCYSIVVPGTDAVIQPEGPIVEINPQARINHVNANRLVDR